jgi:hypothetical protein
MEAPGFAVEGEDFEADKGPTAEEREANLLRSAEDNEIEVEEVKEDKKDDEPPAEEQAQAPADGDDPEPEPGEESYEINGVSVPKSVVEAIAEAVRSESAKDEPKKEAEKAPEPDQFDEALEKAKKAALGDPALVSVVELLGGIRKDMLTREQREQQAKEADKRRQEDMDRLNRDFSEVEKVAGKKLSESEKAALFARAKTLKWNPLKDAYDELYGSTKKAPEKLEAVNSTKAREPRTVGEDVESEAARLARSFGLSSERRKKVLERLGG